jgi:hypothetical protein
MMPGPCVRALRAACLAGDKARGRAGHRAACGRVQASDQVLQTRVVHLPVAFNDKWTNDAIAKYMKSVRPAAEHVHPPGLAHLATHRIAFCWATQQNLPPGHARAAADHELRRARALACWATC